MANIKSAKKRISVINRQKEENKFFKTTVNTYTKKFKKLIGEQKLVEAEAQLKEIVKLVQSSASKGIFHKNNASRKIARLSKQLHIAKNGKKEVAVKAEVKPVEAKVEAPVVAEVKAEKPAAKKPAAKKEVASEEKPAAAKKPAAKKATSEEKPAAAKKPAAKKPAAKKPAAKKEVASEEKPAAKKATTAKKPAAKKAE